MDIKHGKVQINQMIHLRPFIKRINAKHGDIDMGILHTRIFPIRKLKCLTTVRQGIKQKIVRYGVYMRQAPILFYAVNELFQAQDLLLRLTIIPINRWLSIPKRFIIPKNLKLLNLNKNLKNT